MPEANVTSFQIFVLELRLHLMRSIVFRFVVPDRSSRNPITIRRSPPDATPLLRSASAASDRGEHCISRRTPQIRRHDRGTATGGGYDESRKSKAPSNFAPDSCLDDHRRRADDRPMTGDEELIQVEQVIERMIARHPSVPPGDIELIVRDIHKRFSDARVHDFVPLLVEKAARQSISIRAAGTPAPASRTRPRGTRAVTVI